MGTAELAPGTLKKLLEGMESGLRATREHRSSILQVTDILPAGLDQKSLLPEKGFLIRVSDSSQSAYVSLPPEQDDFVLSDKLRLGQLLSVDRLDKASPFPLLSGAKLLPGGRRPISEAGKLAGETILPPRRGSWGETSAEPVLFSTPILRRSCAVAPGSFSSSARFQRSRSVVCERVPNPVISPFSLSGKKSSTPPPRMRNSRVATSLNMAALESRGSPKPSPIVFSKSKPIGGNNTMNSFAAENGISEDTSLGFNLPGKLGALGKEAVQKRDTAQKIALQALREAQATETLVRSLKMFSSLSRNAKPENPASCFERFLEFHVQITQSISDIASIRAATSSGGSSSSPSSSPSVLAEIAPNTTACDSSASKRRNTCNNSEKRILRSASSARKRLVPAETSSGDENARPSGLWSTARLGKQIEKESGVWFMEFVEKALESGMRKQRLSQGLMIKLVNWVECEISKNSNNNRSVSGNGDKRASQIARKLRIKMKNP